MKHAAATLGSGNLRLAVQLPEGEDLNEWVAVNSEYWTPADCSLGVDTSHHGSGSPSMNHHDGGGGEVNDNL